MGKVGNTDFISNLKGHEIFPLFTSKHKGIVLIAIFIFFFSFNHRVDASVIAMGKLLYEVKGSTQGQAISKSEVQAAADAILQPLMDLLDGTFFSISTEN